MATKMFLASVSHVKSPIVPYYKPHYILESFWDLRGGSHKKDEFIRWCLSADMFLLDSGAFAAMNKARKTDTFSEDSVDKYVEEYIAFINKWNIEHFFELDIDKIIGYDRVLEIRRRIEEGTGKKCIPVWHLSRGIENFHKMCKEYNYVAIGGMAAKEFSKEDKTIIPELCRIAHDYGCKIHGLGYMPLSMLEAGDSMFDSVDGTSWEGHMRGQNFKVVDGKITKFKDDRHWKEVAYDCFGFWHKYSYIMDGD